jgi:hypothetical protein
MKLNQSFWVAIDGNDEVAPEYDKSFFYRETKKELTDRLVQCVANAQGSSGTYMGLTAQYWEVCRPVNVQLVERCQLAKNKPTPIPPKSTAYLKVEEITD